MSGRYAVLSGCIAAEGVLSPKTQRLVHQIAESGGVDDALRAVAESLAETEVMPRPDSVAVPYDLSDDTHHRARIGAFLCAQDYEERGGVLLARNYVRREDLAGSVYAAWMARRSPPLTETKWNAEMSAEEYNARFSVAAQELARAMAAYRIGNDASSGNPIQLMDAFGTYHAGPQDYLIAEERLEGFCMMAVKTMFEAFRDPDEVRRERAEKRNDP